MCDGNFMLHHVVVISHVQLSAAKVTAKAKQKQKQAVSSFKTSGQGEKSQKKSV